MIGGSIGPFGPKTVPSQVQARPDMTGIVNVTDDAALTSRFSATWLSTSTVSRISPTDSRSVYGMSG